MRTAPARQHEQTTESWGRPATERGGSVLSPAPVPKHADAPETIDFVVTVAHIKSGSRGHPMRCPVFLALREMGYPVQWVNAMTVGFNGAARYRVPPDLSNWIRNYDNNQPAYPERFRLTRSEMSAGHGAAV